jgi:molybdopterin-guanine dinucleotide biosynthesis protein A
MSAIGILLAGGASARFPSGKLDAVIPAALADQRGRPELAGMRVADAAHATLVAAVPEILVLGEPSLSAPAECIPDRRPLAGPAASLADLLAGDRLRDHHDSTRVLIVAADAPFAPPPLLGLMAAASGSVTVRADQPLPFATSLGALRATVAAHGELPRLRDLAGALAAVPLDVRIVSRLDPLGAALLDIDTPDDLEAPASG